MCRTHLQFQRIILIAPQCKNIDPTFQLAIYVDTKNLLDRQSLIRLIIGTYILKCLTFHMLHFPKFLSCDAIFSLVLQISMHFCKSNLFIFSGVSYTYYCPEHLGQCGIVSSHLQVYDTCKFLIQQHMHQWHQFVSLCFFY